MLTYPARPPADWLPYFGFYSNVTETFGGPLIPGLDPAWSLAVEAQFYLLWAPLLYGTRRGAFRRICLGLLVAAPIARLVLTVGFEGFRPTYRLLPARLDLFAAGALIALAAMGPGRSRLRDLPWGRIGTGCGLLFLSLAAFRPDFRTSANDPLFNTVGYSLLMACAVSLVAHTYTRPESRSSRVLEASPLRLLGLVSYVAYLVHKPILIALPFSPGVRAGLGLTATLIVAGASWQLIEQPLLRWKNRRIPRPALPFEGSPEDPPGPPPRGDAVR